MRLNSKSEQFDWDITARDSIIELYIATIQTKCHPGVPLLHISSFNDNVFQREHSNILPAAQTLSFRIYPVIPPCHPTSPRAEERESTDMGAANNAALITLEPGQEDRGNFLGDPCFHVKSYISILIEEITRNTRRIGDIESILIQTYPNFVPNLSNYIQLVGIEG